MSQPKILEAIEREIASAHFLNRPDHVRALKALRLAIVQRDEWLHDGYRKVGIAEKIVQDQMDDELLKLLTKSEDV